MRTLTAVTAAALLVIFAVPAHAYIDPGSGSYMLQVALAGVLAVVYMLKAYWERFRSSLTGRQSGSVSHQAHREQ